MKKANIKLYSDEAMRLLNVAKSDFERVKNYGRISWQTFADLLNVFVEAFIGSAEFIIDNKKTLSRYFDLRESGDFELYQILNSFSKKTESEFDIKKRIELILDKKNILDYCDCETLKIKNELSPGVRKVFRNSILECLVCVILILQNNSNFAICDSYIIDDMGEILSSGSVHSERYFGYCESDIWYLINDFLVDLIDCLIVDYLLNGKQTFEICNITEVAENV